MSVVQTVNHSTVFRAQREKFTCPEKDYWPLFVKGNPRVFFNQNNPSYSAYLEAAKQYWGESWMTRIIAANGLRLPEHTEQQYVLNIDGQIYGGETEMRPEAPEPTHVDPNITEIKATLATIAASLGIGGQVPGSLQTMLTALVKGQNEIKAALADLDEKVMILLS